MRRLGVRDTDGDRCMRECCMKELEREDASSYQKISGSGTQPGWATARFARRPAVVKVLNSGSPQRPPPSGGPAPASSGAVRLSRGDRGEGRGKQARRSLFGRPAPARRQRPAGPGAPPTRRIGSEESGAAPPPIRFAPPTRRMPGYGPVASRAARIPRAVRVRSAGPRAGGSRSAAAAGRRIWARGRQRRRGRTRFARGPGFFEPGSPALARSPRGTCVRDGAYRILVGIKPDAAACHARARAAATGPAPCFPASLRAAAAVE